MIFTKLLTYFQSNPKVYLNLLHFLCIYGTIMLFHSIFLPKYRSHTSFYGILSALTVSLGVLIAPPQVYTLIPRWYMLFPIFISNSCLMVSWWPKKRKEEVHPPIKLNLTH